MKKLTGRIISCVLVFVLVLNLVGCGSFKETLERIANGDIFGSRWVNSEIEGAIDEKYQTNVKDDFFTAVNKDWILENKPDEITGANVQILNCQKTLNERLIKMVTDVDNPDTVFNDSVGLDAEEIENVRKQVSTFFGEVLDVEKRNSLGTDPLKRYISAIENIDSFEEMKGYISNLDSDNLLGAPIVDISVAPTMTDPTTNYVIVRPVSDSNLALEDPDAYEKITGMAITSKNVYSGIVSYVLEKMGYSESQIKSILRKNYRFEGRLAEEKVADSLEMGAIYEKNHMKDCSVEELSEMVGEYPIEEVIAQYGYTADSYKVLNFECLGHLKNSFVEKNLEEIKAYYITHTIIACADLLDEETDAKVEKILNLGAEPKTGAESVEDSLEDTLSPEDQKTLELIENYGFTYMSAPLNMLYIATYCDAEQKQKMSLMLDDIINEMGNVFAGSDWLSDAGKAAFKEKLDYMVPHVLYPDNYISYKGLDITGDGNLLEMIRDINLYSKQKYAYRVGQKVDRNEWDLDVISTITVNAYNDITANSIYVLAGIVSDGFTFNTENPYEMNLARLGVIIGHEITHGFDDTGSKYNKYGMETGLSEDQIMSTEDFMAFSKKTFKLVTGFASMSPIPGEGGYAANVSGEAIADMGGMKCAIQIGENTENFDFDLFFRSYAELWRKVNTREIEKMYAKADVHPLAFYRVNVILAQFDKFRETYDIKPGDGMYLDDNDRFLVW